MLRLQPIRRQSESRPAPSSRKGSGEPVLLIHPFTMSHHVWRRVVDELGPGYDVLAVTLPGHLGTERCSLTDMTPERMADTVEELLDEIGWAHCHVAGNSLGGWVAFELARRGRARTVTAFAPAGGWQPWSRDAFLLGAKFAALAPAVLSASVAGSLARRAGVLGPVSSAAGRLLPELPPPAQDVLACLEAAAGCHGFAGVLLAGMRGLTAEGLEEVRCPVRLVLCEKDRIVPPPRYFSRFLEELPFVEAVTLADIGHVPMLQDPAACARLLREHVAAYTTPEALEA